MFSAKVLIFLAAVAVCYGAPNTNIHNNRLKINGGVDAKIEDYPFVASIQYCINGCEHICGGVIVNKNWILTASGCAQDTTKVAVGSADLQSDDTVLVDIESRYLPPDHAPEGGFGPNDLALIKLAKPLTFSDKVQAAKLPKQGQEFTGTAVLTAYNYTTNPVINKLKADFDVTLISYEDCSKQINMFFNFQYYLLSKTSNICTSNSKKISNTCYADFGSPLSQDGTVIGTVSWYVFPCGSKETPNVYTKLSNFADWINKTITENS